MCISCTRSQPLLSSFGPSTISNTPDLPTKIPLYRLRSASPALDSPISSVCTTPHATSPLSASTSTSTLPLLSLCEEDDDLCIDDAATHATTTHLLHAARAQLQQQHLMLAERQREIDAVRCEIERKNEGWVELQFQCDALSMSMAQNASEMTNLRKSTARHGATTRCMCVCVCVCECLCVCVCVCACLCVSVCACYATCTLSHTCHVPSSHMMFMYLSQENNSPRSISRPPPPHVMVHSLSPRSSPTPPHRYSPPSHHMHPASHHNKL